VYVGGGLVTGWFPVPILIGSRNEKGDQGPKKGCKAIIIIIIIYYYYIITSCIWFNVFSKYGVQGDRDSSRYSDNPRAVVRVSVGTRYVLFTTSVPVHGPTQFPIQRVTGAPSPGIKRSRSEAGQSPISDADVKNTWIST
jgi:hypothetical protein